jgi:uncharacterized protein YkwD
MAGVRPMSVGVGMVAAATLQGACAMTPSDLSSGYAETPAPRAAEARAGRSSPARAEPGAGRGLGLSLPTFGFAAPATTAKAAVPTAADKAPKGSFEKAPVGSLSDRDYTKTRLDPEAARATINRYRAEHGLKPLRLSAELTVAAKMHARDLAKWDRISHYGSDGSNPWDRAKRAGFDARVAAENVGTGQVDFAEVMRGWKDSPGHNRNLLLADATDMGVALVHDPKTEFKSFWTLVVGSPK